MAFNIQDFITKQVTSAMGSVDVPSAAKNQVLNGLTESILGSLTQTATKAGGIEQLKNLLTNSQRKQLKNNKETAQTSKKA